MAGKMGILDRVGTLYRWDPISKQATEPRTVSAHRPFLAGRDRKTCDYVLDDARVSGQHLRIYTVVYDFENPLEITPLVYAQDVSTNGTFWNGQRIDRRNGGAVLLSDGDILRLSPSSFLEYRSEFQSERPLTSVQKEEAKDFADEYLITDRILGEGSFGQVRMAVNLNSPSQVACKVVNLCAGKTIRKGADTDLFELQKREVLILKKLCHPNIIALEKVILTENSLYIFEELITAGDLFTFIEAKGESITDFDAASIVQQILIALNYLHDKDIVHRDLKPENILMTSHGVCRRVVLADFGCAQIMCSKSKRMSTVVGTWDYTAPEVYTEVSLRGYTRSVDLWSVGCITVVLLIGTPPFQFPASEAIEDVEIGDMNEVFMNIRWDQASTWAQNFVLSLLVLDERKRLTAQEALQHSWFTNAQYKSKLKQNYEKAVRDWRPRGTQPPHESKKLLKAHACLVDSSKAGPLSKFRHPDSKISERIQDEQLDIEKGKDSEFLNAKYSSYKHDVRENSVPMRRSFSPQAWSTKVCERRDLLSSSKINASPERRAWPKLAVKQAQKPWLYTSKELNDDSKNSSDIPLLVSIPVTGIKRHIDEFLSQSPEEGEVYEEIENKITGKIQRVLYKER